MPGVPESPIPAEASDRLIELDVRDSWPLLSRADRSLAFQLLSREHAGDFFLSLPTIDQAELLTGMPTAERRTWIRALPPHDAAHVVRAAGERSGRVLLSLLDETTRHEVIGLIAHAEDSAGGLMDPRYARLRAEMTVEEALWYLRQQLRERRHTLTYAYVLDEAQRLVGVVPHWQLLVESEAAAVRDIMKKDVISIREDLPEGEVARRFKQHPFKALPIVDGEGRMRGVITAEDVVHILRESAIQDIQKIGGVEVLEEPYLRISLSRLLRKRVGWLAAVFIGEMLTPRR